MIPTAHDARRHKRVPARGHPARVLIGGTWHEGRLVDISGGGAAVDLALRAPVGEQVVLSDNDLGLIGGRVTRRRETGPALAFEMDDRRRDALVDSLTLWHNGDLFA